MRYEVDYDYPFEYDENEIPYLPDGVAEDGNLYVLPNGHYVLRNGESLIYEPSQTSFFADMLASLK